LYLLINGVGLIARQFLASAVCETLTKWNGIRNVIENERYVYLVLDRIAGYILLKRFFKDETEMNEFIGTIRTKIKK